MITLWLVVSLAFADAFYLEAPPVDARVEAVALQEEARLLGMDARVTRRYRHGSGWEFVVVVEGFDERPGAEDAARRLAEQTGQGIAVYRLESTGRAPTADVEPASPLPEASLPEAADLLQRASRSLGGVQGGQVRLESAESLWMQYDRTVLTAEAQVKARHEWASRGDLRRVEVVVADGPPGVNSSFGTGPQGPWVRVDGKVSDAQADVVTEVLASLSPMARLAWPLQFALRQQEVGPYRVARQEEVAGRTCWVLVALTPGPDDPTRLWLDVEEGRPVRVDFTTDGGRFELTLTDWREPDTGVVVPFVVEVRRDAHLVERIEVLEFTLGSDLPDALFVRPGEG